MIYAAIDTNVLVSALLNFDSNPGQALLAVFGGEVTPLVNETILAEYRDVLTRKKFRFPADLVEVILARLTACSLNLSDVSADYPEVTDPNDRCFYAVTMSERQTEDALLVTGNIRHFPVRPFVVTPAQFVGILQAERQRRQDPH